MDSSLKKTLFLPKTDFPMRANLVERQREYLEKWKKEEIYNERLRGNKDKPLFVIVDGPPYANGPIHMGHALNKILKDFVVRWKNISGYQAPILVGWDTHGLPIENKLERENKDFKNLPPIEKRKLAKEYALSQVELQKSQLKLLNLSFPLEPNYKTLNPKFSEQEYQLFLDLYEKGLIKREYKPVAWSCSSQTALAEAEIEYKKVNCESIYFCFEIVYWGIYSYLKDSKVILWTTIPYSLVANQAIGFNPNLRYCLIKYLEEKYLISEDFYNSGSITEKLGWEKEKIQKIKTITEYEISALKYHNPISNKECSFLNATFIHQTQGSGFVHLASGLGKDDYLVAKENNLEIYCPIDKDGLFKEDVQIPELIGEHYKDPKVFGIIKQRLINSGCFVRVDEIDHDAGHDWRTGEPILYRASEQFFLDVLKAKEEYFDSFSKQSSVERELYKPEWIGRELTSMTWHRREWCISRQKAWGLPIPFIFKNGKDYGGLEQLKRNIELLKKNGIECWFTQPVSFFLENIAEEELSQFSKCTDVLDVWFDSGCVFKYYKKWLNDNEWLFGKRDPEGILHLEGSDQCRGWFNASTFLSVICESEFPSTQLVAHGFVLDENQNKMSKSKGNIVDPVQLISEFGADVLRLWIASINYEKDISFSREKLFLAQQEYRKFRNILFRFSLSVLEKVEWEKIKLEDLSIEQLKYPENKYICSRFLELLQHSTKAFDDLDFHKVIGSFKSFTDLWSTWYLELVKPHIYSKTSSDPYKNEILKIIAIVFKYSLFFLSPIIPQTTEQVYGFLSFSKKEESLWLEKEKFSYKTLHAKYLSNAVEEKKWQFYLKINDFLKNKGQRENFTVFIEKSKFNYFAEKEWLRMLNVLEVKREEIEGFRVLYENFSINKVKCPRCLFFISVEKLEEINFEDKQYKVCPNCLLALKEYREKNKRS